MSLSGELLISGGSWTCLYWKHLMTPGHPTHRVLVPEILTVCWCFVELTADHLSVSGLLGALPHSWPHHAVPAWEWQGASVDPGQRRACDISTASGPRVLSQTPRLLPRRHSNGPSLSYSGRRVHWPQEPQIRYEAAVWDVRVGRGTERVLEGRGENHFCFKLLSSLSLFQLSFFLIYIILVVWTEQFFLISGLKTVGFFCKRLWELMLFKEADCRSFVGSDW